MARDFVYNNQSVWIPSCYGYEEAISWLIARLNVTRDEATQIYSDYRQHRKDYFANCLNAK